MNTRKASKTFLFIILWNLFLQFSVSIVFSIADLPLSYLTTPYAMIINQLLGLLLPTVLVTKFRKENLKLLVPHKKLGGKNILMIIGITYLIMPVMMMISGISTFLFGANVAADLVGGLAELQHPFLLMLLAIAVTPAIIEELVFRGYIQSTMPKMPIGQMAFVGGLFFGIIHLNLQQFFYAFAMGVIWVIVVHYTKSILAGVLSHFLVNGSQVSLMYLAIWAARVLEDTAYGGYATDLTAALSETNNGGFGQMILTMGIFSAITLPFAILLLKYFVRYNKERNLNELETENAKQEVYNEFLAQENPNALQENDFSNSNDSALYNYSWEDRNLRGANFWHNPDEVKSPWYKDPLLWVIVLIFLMMSILILMGPAIMEIAEGLEI